MGFIETARKKNWAVDVLCPQNPRDFRKSKEFAELISTKICWPEDLTRGRNPWKISLEGLSFSDVLGFEQVILKQSETTLYDMFIVNQPEGLMALANMQFDQFVPVVYQTHSPHLVWPSNTNYRNPFWYDAEMNLLKSTNALVGTQAKNNFRVLSEQGLQPVELPPYTTTDYLLTPNNEQREGVMFVGRWEDRKNPQKFVNMIKATGLPAKILCGSKQDKWHAAFKDAGVTNYQIEKLTGEEKAKFLKSAQVAYHPASSESFGLGAFETAHHSWTVLPFEHKWSRTFKDFPSVRIVPESKVREKILELYDTPNEDYLPYIRDYNQKSLDAWDSPFHRFRKEYRDVQARKFVKDSGGLASVQDWWEHKKRLQSFDVSEIKTLYSNLDFVQAQDHTNLKA